MSGLEEVSGGVCRMDGIAPADAVDVSLISSEGGLTLVDTGVAGCENG